MGEPWDMQPNETTQSYEAFNLYCKMGRVRSQEKVASELGKSTELMGRWSRRHNWVSRAAAWDAYLDGKARDQNAKEILAMRKRHAKIAKKALDKVSDAIDKIDPENISNSDIARLLGECAKLERLSRGDTSEVIEDRDGGQAVNPVQIYLPDNMRDREIEPEDK